MYDSLHIVPLPPRAATLSLHFTSSRATPALSPLRRATSLPIVFPCRFSPLLRLVAGFVNNSGSSRSEIFMRPRAPVLHASGWLRRYR